jgi:hypothetical protein
MFPFANALRGLSALGDNNLDASAAADAIFTVASAQTPMISSFPSAKSAYITPLVNGLYSQGYVLVQTSNPSAVPGRASVSELQQAIATANASLPNPIDSSFLSMASSFFTGLESSGYTFAHAGGASSSSSYAPSAAVGAAQAPEQSGFAQIFNAFGAATPQVAGALQKSPKVKKGKAPIAMPQQKKSWWPYIVIGLGATAVVGLFGYGIYKRRKKQS